MWCPGWSGSSSSVGRSFPRPEPLPQATPPRSRRVPARTLSPRRSRPRKRGRASAPCGQWGQSLGAGAWRPRHDAPSGGCFKMADVAGPSRPGAAAFWSRDSILRPAGRGRRRPPRGRRGAGGRVRFWEDGRSTVLTPGTGTCCSASSRSWAFLLRGSLVSFLGVGILPSWVSTLLLR
jgi:hypothetical protein